MKRWRSSYGGGFSVRLTVETPQPHRGACIMLLATTMPSTLCGMCATSLTEIPPFCSESPLRLGFHPQRWFYLQILDSFCRLFLSPKLFAACADICTASGSLPHAPSKFSRIISGSDFFPQILPLTHVPRFSPGTDDVAMDAYVASLTAEALGPGEAIS